MDSRIAIVFFLFLNVCLCYFDDEDNELQRRSLIGDLQDLTELKPHRFLGFPTPSTLLLQFVLGMPVSAVSEIKSIAFQTDMLLRLDKKFPLPKKEAPAPKATTTTKAPAPIQSSYVRNPYQRVSEDDFSRATFYEEIERFLDRQGMDGRQCLLRAICEVAEAPFDHGMYGDVINFLLTSTVSRNETEYYDEYRTAEYYGKHYGHCDKIYELCPASVLDMYSQAL